LHYLLPIVTILGVIRKIAGTRRPQVGTGCSFAVVQAVAVKPLVYRSDGGIAGATAVWVD